MESARRSILTITGPKLFVTSIMSAELIGEAPATPPKTKRRRKATTAAKAQKREESSGSYHRIRFFHFTF